MDDSLRLAVLEPGAPEHPAGDDHLPVHLCAFAACTSGSLHSSVRSVLAGTDAGAPVLVGLANPLWRCLRAVRSLRRAGRTVLVAFAGAGGMQTTDLIVKPREFTRFLEICGLASGAVATTPEAVPVLRGAGVRHVEYVPLPLPLGDPRWDLAVQPWPEVEPSAEAGRHGEAGRRGMLVGTVEFAPLYRNQVMAVANLRALAQEAGEPVTLVHSGRPHDRAMALELRALWPDGLMRVLGPLSGVAFTRELARHKLAFQLDWTGGAGETAAAALLAGVPCVGGHGALERLAFPQLSGYGRTPAELVELAAKLLADPAAAQSAVAAGRALATEHASYEAARPRLTAALHASAARNPAPPSTTTRQLLGL